MKRLYELTQRLTGPEQQKLADRGRVTLATIDRELAEKTPRADPGAATRLRPPAPDPAPSAQPGAVTFGSGIGTGFPAGAGAGAGVVPAGGGAGAEAGGFGGLGGGFGGGDDAGDDDSYLRIAIAAMGPRLTAADKSPTTRAVVTKLEEPIEMAFGNETPLEDVLKYIKAATAGTSGKGVPIYVDPVGLQEAEKTMVSIVQLDLEGVPLKTTLRLLLKQLGLAYCVKDGLIFISTPSGIFQELKESLTAHPEVREELDYRDVPMMGRPGKPMMGGRRSGSQ